MKLCIAIIIAVLFNFLFIYLTINGYVPEWVFDPVGG